jgi:hypothetical protein
VEFYKGVRKGSRITFVVCFFGFYLTLTNSLIYRCIGFSTFSTTVSTTRAVCYAGTSINGKLPKYKSRDFTQQEADRLMRKKLTGLSICQNNLECLVDEVIEDDYLVRPVLHILTPNKLNAIMCMKSYKDLLVENKLDLTEIKVIISCVENHKDVL